MYVWEITRGQQDGGAEQSHLFIGELQTTETFSQVEHGADQVIAPCKGRGRLMTRQKQHGSHLEDR